MTGPTPRKAVPAGAAPLRLALETSAARSGRRAAVRLAALLVLSLLHGCLGGDGGPDPFRLCGNGTIDPGEQCDDGFPPPTPSPVFLGDNDDCLSTCQLNVCGDEILNTRGPSNIEVCDGRALGNRTCLSLGFSGGTLACASDCAGYDTSRCTPRPPALVAGTTPAPPPTSTATAAN